MASTKISTAFAAYQALVEGIVTEGDESYVEAVEAYVAAESGDKARMRAYAGSKAQEAMLALDVTDEAAVARTKALVALGKAQSDAVATKAPTVIDWNERLATRLATLDYAADLVRTGHTVPEMPEGTEVDFDVIVARAAELMDEESVHAAAAKLAAQSIGRGSIAEGGDIAEHVVQALTILGDGFHKVSEIRNQVTDEYPADQRPSSGAITQRLFPRDGSACTIEGVVPMASTSEHPQGARLA